MRRNEAAATSPDPRVWHTDDVTNYTWKMSRWPTPAASRNHRASSVPAQWNSTMAHLPRARPPNSWHWSNTNGQTDLAGSYSHRAVQAWPQLAMPKSLHPPPLRCQDWITKKHELWVREIRLVKIRLQGTTQVEDVRQEGTWTGGTESNRVLERPAWWDLWLTIGIKWLQGAGGLAVNITLYSPVVTICTAQWSLYVPPV